MQRLQACCARCNQQAATAQAGSWPSARSGAQGMLPGRTDSIAFYPNNAGPGRHLVVTMHIAPLGPGAILALGEKLWLHTAASGVVWQCFV